TYAEFLKTIPAGEIPELADKVVYLTQGSIAPPFEGVDIGIGEKFVMESIATFSGYTRKQIEILYKEKGDLGDVASLLAGKKKQTSLGGAELTVEHVYQSFQKIAAQSGQGSQSSKIGILAELLNSASPVEAKYIVRFPLGKLRLGIGDPTILDALSLIGAQDKSMRQQIERAYNLCSDLGYVAKIFLEDQKSISRLKVTPFKPIRPALAEREISPQAIIERTGECSVEAKYDGLRMQVHKSGDKVEIYSRKLEKMTGMFPDIVKAARGLDERMLIFEGEALAYSPEENKYFSFQQLMQRKRKYDIGKMSQQLPLQMFAFDIMLAGSTDFTLEPYSIRREKLELLLGSTGTKKQDFQGVILPSARIIARSAQELEEYFQKCLSEGLEGVIAKDLRMPYVAGARKFAWIKLKKSYGSSVDTIDAVVVGYYLGKGARSEFEFGGLLVAVQNEQTGALETVAKIGSGFSEEEMRELQERLYASKSREKPKGVESRLEPDFWVEPSMVVTVAFDEISQSSQHTCSIDGEGRGLALRFPRLVGIREDKGTVQATTSAEVLEMFGLQRRAKA
ncbi:ATP-dependent DNA ligase, partial [Candidatus Parvarchaeota archaeon]|nr:ATP-dependent DNA ligase [Candidatus Parvarchaeota archaeon]